MGYPPAVALQIRQPENFLDTYARIMQLKSMAVQGQSQQLQYQHQVLEQQDDQKIRDAVHNSIDPDTGQFDEQKFLKNAYSSGVPPTSKPLQDYQKYLLQQKMDYANMQAKQVETAQKINDQYRGRLMSIIEGPEEQKLTAWDREIAAEEKAGMVQPGTVSHIYPGDDAAQSIANHFAIGSTLAKETSEAQQAAARKSQADTAAAKLAAEQNPQSPLYAPTPAAISAKVQGGDTSAYPLASDDILSHFAAKGDQQAQTELDARRQRKIQTAGQTAGAEAAAKFPWEARLEQMRQQGDPVFAYDPKSKQTVQVSRSEAQASGFTNIVKVGQSEIDKAKTSAMQLGDATMNIQAYKQASQRMDELSGSDIATVSRVLGSDQFKAHFLGLELPVDWANKLYQTKGWTDMPESAKDAVVNYIAARPAAISLLRAINPGVRLTESQIATELKNIPDPTTPSDIRDRQFARLDRNIDQASKTLVKIPGVDLPSEIRDRLASQSGAEQAARAKVQAAEDAKSGQYTDPKKSHQVGEKLLYKGEWRRVTKVYKDNSFDMESE